ncbi:asparagine synthase (glutamine-hydrolyzing) [Salisediminibacterium beveridgei]|uniref:asparagine synthase (glutamine-hydrolyzing) n=1 Tax=Salisediminibacterium beveridgei TaxID=632773 RepID=A0A1D7QZU3_9BACI|nr:asparagine synthase (glutamine-hydrolyzing) [Salisediminibacterium beveridgei]AOM84525.1 Asparagine synthetase (glutamine-hydrolyzing) [Salisediminibacterium beveridgei]
MCGFTAIAGSFLPDQKQMNEMTSAIFHRGPDETGYYRDEYVSFGFQRLSIIDLENGQQPFSYENERYVIVFNGEIYNHVELRKELVANGVQIDTVSDTEVIVALYHHSGVSCLQKLRGMFAFVIWDKETKTIFAARDHFGIKPLYYTNVFGSVVFSSESKAITHLTTELTVNDPSLQHYLAFQFIPEPETIWSEVKKLPAGHYVEIPWNAEVQAVQYWQPQFRPERSSYDYQKAKILDVLRESVSVHLRSDVPVGSFLSGGIDSAVIVSLAKEVNPAIKTFSVGFDQSGYSETAFARQTAEALQVSNEESILTPEAYWEALPKLMWHMDEPVADPAAVPLYFVARQASEQVKVVLSGEGSDELFGGYNIYRKPRALRQISALPGPAKKLLAALSRMIPDGVKGKSFLERGTTPLMDRYIGNANIVKENEKSRILKSYDANRPSALLTEPYFNASKELDDVTKMQAIDLAFWLKGDILAKADKMTMANSLELRVPFLDKQVFEVASAIPVAYKIAHGTTKYILRDAVREILPEEVFMRKKLGFPVPIKHWLRGEWNDRVYQLIEESQTDAYFDKRYLIHLLDEHKQCKGDHSRKLWNVLIFMIWHEVFVEQIHPFHQPKPARPSNSSSYCLV